MFAERGCFCKRLQGGSAHLPFQAGLKVARPPGHSPRDSYGAFFRRASTSAHSLRHAYCSPAGGLVAPGQGAEVGVLKPLPAH
jgi:hypothetical protein